MTSPDGGSALPDGALPLPPTADDLNIKFGEAQDAINAAKEAQRRVETLEPVAITKMTMLRASALELAEKMKEYAQQLEAAALEITSQ